AEWKYEPGLIVADSDFVIANGRFTRAPVNWIAADVLRTQDGILVEHRDVLQDEANQSSPKAAGPCSAIRSPPGVLPHDEGERGSRSPLSASPPGDRVGMKGRFLGIALSLERVPHDRSMSSAFHTLEGLDI